MVKKIRLALVLLLVLQSLTNVNADMDCETLLLVSNWKDNNVKIFDACSGDFMRDLDTEGLIDGPLAITESNDGDILVVSETNNRLIKFDGKSLSFGQIVTANLNDITGKPLITKPSSAVLGNDGFMYLASYGTNEIIKVNPATWTLVEQILEPNNKHIKGIDAGMKMTSNGDLIVPGYDSDNIIRINLATKEITQLVSSGAHGLDAPRTILLREEQNEFLVTAERSNQVMAFSLDSGEFLRILVNIARPTGMMADDTDHFIVNNHDAVFRIDYAGKVGQKIINNGRGGLDSGTFVYIQRKKLVEQQKTN